MSTAIPKELEQKLRASGIIAVLVIDDPEHAVPLAKTLLQNGINAMELTLRTGSALVSLKRISTEVPEMLAGVGTILTPENAVDAQKSGAVFGVAPGFNPRVVDKAIEIQLPFGPGISIPSEIEWAVEKGCRTLKFFHAENMGGVNYLKGINAPYEFLNLSYIPLGGLTPSNIHSYLEMPQVLALGGSWIAPRNLIQAGDWDKIGRNAAEAIKILREVRG